jgi:DNA-directed RNA polymerase II subunit RPB2
MVKVKIRSLKIPEIGDKVASRSAQKGTVGMIYPQEDMPFCNKTGMVPDLIINPLCLPSRMTINQIIECIGSKSCAMMGKFRYGTPFTRHSTDVVDHLCDSLRDCGLENHGKEKMSNGFTGEQFDAEIFIGPTYYHRLKHLVSNKIHARNHGSLQALTRQPVEGRSRDGGLRFGEMERDCMISHGVSRFLTERLFDMSDVFSVIVCTKCGTIPHCSDFCNVCENNKICRLFIPYACKLLFQELMAMCIKINLLPLENKRVGVKKITAH